MGDINSNFLSNKERNSFEFMWGIFKCGEGYDESSEGNSNRKVNVL